MLGTLAKIFFTCVSVGNLKSVKKTVSNRTTQQQSAHVVEQSCPTMSFSSRFPQNGRLKQERDLELLRFFQPHS
jgi:hypothetical protein